MYRLFPKDPSILDLAFPTPLSIPDKKINVARHGTKSHLSTKCYLCMNNILPSSKDTVVVRCFEKCGTRLHYKCVKDSMWSPKGENIVCPTCTKDEHENRKYGWGIDRPFLATNGMREEEFLRKMARLFDQSSRRQLLHTLLQIRLHIDRKANVISGRCGVDTMVHTSIGDYIAQDLRLPELLNLGCSIAGIHRYLTNRIEGLMLIGLCVEDLAQIERNGDMVDFVKLYQVSSPMLRSYLGQDEMSLPNLIRARLTPVSMDILGITVHELCILRLTQDEMHCFDWLSMKDWIQSLRMTPTCIRVLRITTGDFVHPKGKMGRMGWDLERFCSWMNLTANDRLDLRLSKQVARVSYAKKARNKKA